MNEKSSAVEPIDVLLINIGSNSNEKNSIAPIFSDGSFEYWPIAETRPGRRTPRFKDLKIRCEYPDLYAHYDPCFEPRPTYGDIRDVPAIRSLNESAKRGRTPALLFAATLRYKVDPSPREPWIQDGIGYYIIGYFLIREIRFASKTGSMNWSRHEHNAHYRRPKHDKGVVKILIEGSRGSRLLKKPYPISVRPKLILEPNVWLRRNFRELRGGLIGGGPWYRRTFRNARETSSAAVISHLFAHERRT